MLMIRANIFHIARVRTRLYADICAVPAHVMAFYSSGHALGMYHS